MANEKQTERLYNQLVKDGVTFGGKTDRASFDALRGDSARMSKLYKIATRKGYKLGSEDDFQRRFGTWGEAAVEPKSAGVAEGAAATAAVEPNTAGTVANEVKSGDAKPNAVQPNTAAENGETVVAPFEGKDYSKLDAQYQMGADGKTMNALQEKPLYQQNADEIRNEEEAAKEARANGTYPDYKMNVQMASQGNAADRVRNAIPAIKQKLEVDLRTTNALDKLMANKVTPALDAAQEKIESKLQRENENKGVFATMGGTYTPGGMNYQPRKLHQNLDEKLKSAADAITKEDADEYFKYVYGIDPSNASDTERAKMAKQLAGEIQRRMYSDYARNNAPKSDLEYVMSSAVLNSLTGKMLGVIMGDYAGGTAPESERQALSEGLNDYGKHSSEWLNVVAGFVPMAVDAPLFAYGSYMIGAGAAGAGVTNAVANGMGRTFGWINKVNPLYNPRVFSMTGKAGRVANFLSRWAGGGVSTALTMLPYNLMSNALDGKQRGAMDSAEMVWDSALEAAKTGIFFGGAGALGASAPATATTLRKASQYALGFGAESAYMGYEDLSNQIAEYNMANGFVNEDGSLKEGALTFFDGDVLKNTSIGKAVGHGVGMALAFKLQHAVQHPKEFVNQFKTNRFASELGYDWTDNDNDVMEMLYGKDHPFVQYMRDGKMPEKSVWKQGDGVMAEARLFRRNWIEDTYRTMMADESLPLEQKRKLALMFENKMMGYGMTFGSTRNEGLMSGGAFRPSVEVSMNPFDVMTDMEQSEVDGFYVVRAKDRFGNVLFTRRSKMPNGMDERAKEEWKIQQTRPYAAAMMLNTIRENEGVVYSVNDATLNSALDGYRKEHDIEKILNRVENGRGEVSEEDMDALVAYLDELDHVGQSRAQRTIDEGTREDGTVVTANDKNGEPVVVVGDEAGTDVVTINMNTGEKEHTTTDTLSDMAEQDAQATMDALSETYDPNVGPRPGNVVDIETPDGIEKIKIVRVFDDGAVLFEGEEIPISREGFDELYANAQKTIAENANEADANAKIDELNAVRDNAPYWVKVGEEWIPASDVDTSTGKVYATDLEGNPIEGATDLLGAKAYREMMAAEAEKAQPSTAVAEEPKSATIEPVADAQGTVTGEPNTAEVEAPQVAAAPEVGVAQPSTAEQVVADDGLVRGANGKVDLAASPVDKAAAYLMSKNVNHEAFADAQIKAIDEQIKKLKKKTSLDLDEEEAFQKEYNDAKNALESQKQHWQEIKDAVVAEKKRVADEEAARIKAEEDAKAEEERKAKEAAEAAERERIEAIRKKPIEDLAGEELDVVYGEYLPRNEGESDDAYQDRLEEKARQDLDDTRNHKVGRGTYRQRMTRAEMLGVDFDNADPSLVAASALANGVKFTPDSMQQELGGMLGEGESEKLKKNTADAKHGGKSIAQWAHDMMEDGRTDGNGAPLHNESEYMDAMIEAMGRGGREENMRYIESMIPDNKREEDMPTFWTPRRAKEYSEYHAAGGPDGEASGTGAVADGGLPFTVEETAMFSKKNKAKRQRKQQRERAKVEEPKSAEPGAVVAEPNTAEERTAEPLGTEAVEEKPRSMGNASRHREDVGLERDAHTATLDKGVVDAVDAIASRLGFKVRFTDEVAGGDANAKYEKGTREVEIEKGNPNPVKFLFGHEMMHHVRETDKATDSKGNQSDGKAFGQYASAAKAALGEKEFKARMDKKRETYHGASEDLLAEEVCADFAGDIMENTDLAKRFVQNANVGLLGKVKEYLRTWRDLMFGDAKDVSSYFLLDAMKEVEQIVNDEVRLQNEALNEEGGTMLSKRDLERDGNPDDEAWRKEHGIELRDAYKLMRLTDDKKLQTLYIGRETYDLGSWMNGDSPNTAQLDELEQDYFYLFDENNNVVAKKPIKYGAKNRILGLSANEIREANDKNQRWMAIGRYANGGRKYANMGINGAEGVTDYALRPGVHAGSQPVMEQIGSGTKEEKAANGGMPLRDDNLVWVKGKVMVGLNDEEMAELNEKGEIQSHIPSGGYIKGTSSFVTKGMDWFITNAFKPERIIGDREARDIIDEYNANREDGTDALPYDYNRRGGRMFNAETLELEDAKNDVTTSLNESGFEANDGAVTDVNFSLKYSPKDEKEMKKAIDEIIEATGRKRKDVKRWLDSEMTLAAIFGNEMYREYLDYKVDDTQSFLKSNSDYPQGSVDFNNICRKRIPATYVWQMLQHENPNRILTAKDLANMVNVLKEEGIEVPCAPCFVEDRRQKLGEIADSFVKAARDNFKAYGAQNPTKEKVAEKVRGILKDYTPEELKDILDIDKLITLDGNNELRENYPEVYDAFLAYNNARGQQAGRLFVNYAEYKREIRDWDDARVKRVNDEGGLRIFSTSDFEAHHLLDIVQIVQDCAMRGVKIQGYTKVPSFARAVAKTGIKLNLSLIPSGYGYHMENGKVVLDFDTVEGIDVNHEDFKAIDPNNPNVGTIVIGINDEHIRACMTDPFIDYIIPFHTGLKMDIRRTKGIDHWKNYKLQQMEKINGKSAKHNEAVNIYTDVIDDAIAKGEPMRNKVDFVNKYLKVCKERGIVPKYQRFLDRDKDGNYIYTEGFHKLLVDFKMFDKNGKLLPFDAVKPEFDDELNRRIVDEYLKDEQTDFDYEPVLAKVREKLGLEQPSTAAVKGGSDAMYSLKPEDGESMSDFAKRVEEAHEARKTGVRKWKMEMKPGETWSDYAKRLERWKRTEKQAPLSQDNWLERMYAAHGSLSRDISRAVESAMWMTMTDEMQRKGGYITSGQRLPQAIYEMDEVIGEDNNGNPVTGRDYYAKMNEGIQPALDAQQMKYEQMKDNATEWAKDRLDEKIEELDEAKDYFNRLADGDEKALKEPMPMYSLKEKPNTASPEDDFDPDEPNGPGGGRRRYPYRRRDGGYDLRDLPWVGGRKKATTATFFSGGGLLEQGLRGAIKPSIAVEFSPKIAGVYRENNGDHIVVADVRSVDVEELVKNVDGGHVSYFHASPVCKNFSTIKVNNGEQELDKETASATADALEKMNPRAFTVENVAAYRSSDALNIITDRLDDMGYTYDIDVYNAADYGAPTSRNRMILRAVAPGLTLPPKPSHTERSKGWFYEVEDLMEDQMEAEVPEWMKERAEKIGLDLEHVKKPLYIAYGTKGRSLAYAYGDDVAPAITAGGGDERIFMPDGRVYRVGKDILARLSGLPDDYELPTSNKLAHTVIGNGIPTHLTSAVIVPLIESRVNEYKEKMAISDKVSKEYMDAAQSGDVETATRLFNEYVFAQADDNIVPVLYGNRYRDGGHSEIAKKLKTGDKEAIDMAVKSMAPRVPANAVLVPMPSRTGKATDTIHLAKALAEATGVEMLDILEGLPRESVYEAKKLGHKINPEMLGMRLVGDVPEGKIPVFVDNVIDRGITGAAAVRAAKGGIVLAYAKTNKMNNGISLKSAEPITYDDNGKVIPLGKRFDVGNNDVRYSLKEEQIHSGNFKRWFGDWENEPKSASKVVDKDGKPLEVYHGTPNGGFYTFDKSKVGSRFGLDNEGFFFTDSQKTGKEYALPDNMWDESNPKIYGTYLDIKNPYVVTKGTFGRIAEGLNAVGVWDHYKAAIMKSVKDGGHDGVIIDVNARKSGKAPRVFIAFEPEQIKSSTENNGEFSRENPDIRYSLKNEQEAIDRVNDMRNEIAGMMAKQAGRKNDAKAIKELVDDLTRFVNGNMNKVLGSAIDSTRIKGILSQIDNATSKQDLEQPVREIQTMLNDAAMQLLNNRMNSLMTMPLQSKNQRGVATAVAVDETVRGALQNVRDNQKQNRAQYMADYQRDEQDYNDMIANGDPIPDDLAMRMNVAYPIREMRVAIDEQKVDLETAKNDWESAVSAIYQIRRAPGYMAQRRQQRIVAQAAQDLYIQKQHEYNLAVQDFNGFVSGVMGVGADRLSAWRKAKTARKKMLVHEAMGDVKYKHVPLEGEPGSTLENRTAGQKVSDAWKAVKSWGELPMQSLNFMLQMVDQNHANKEGFLYKHFFLDPKSSVVAANDNMADGREAFGKELNDAVERIFGIKPSKTDGLTGKNSYVRLTEDSRKELGTTIVRRMTKGEAASYNKHLVDGRDDWQEGEDFAVKGMNKGHALYLWLTWRQPDGKMKMANQGYDDAAIQQIEQSLGPEYIQFGEWVTDEFLPRLRKERYNERHVEMYGTSMAENPHYFPLKLDKDKIAANGEFGQPKEQFMPSTITPNLIKRSRNNIGVDADANALEILQQYGNVMEQWYNMAPVIEEFNTLHASPAFRKAMEANQRGSFQMLMQAAQVATGSLYENVDHASRAIEKVLNKSISAGARAAIGFRLMTAVKQIFSYPAFYAYSANPKYIGELSTLWLLPAQNHKWAKENLPAYRQRVRESDMGFEGLGDRDSWGTIDRMISKLGMAPNRLLDQLTVAAGARAVYNQAMRDLMKQGYNRQDAHERAVLEAEICYNESQQSSRNEFSSRVQKSSSAIMRPLTLFQNANIGYARQIRAGLWDMQKAYRRHGKDSFMQKVWWQSAASVGIFGGILHLAWQMAGNTNNIGGMLSGNLSDDEKDGYTTAFILGMLTNGTTLGAPVNAFVNGYGISQTKLLDSLNDLVEVKRRSGLDSVAFWQKVAEGAAQAGLGISFDTWKNIGNAVVDLCSPSTYGSETLAPDLALDIMLLMNMSKTDRAGWASRMYEKYGAVKFSQAYEKAKQWERDNRHNNDIAKLYVTRIDADFEKEMERLMELDKKYRSHDTSDEEAAEILKNEPMLEKDGIFADYKVLMEHIKSNIKEQNDTDRGAKSDAEIRKAMDELIAKWKDATK